MFDKNALSQLEANYQATKQKSVPRQNQKKKGNLLTSLLPAATSIGGGAAGAAIGTALLPGIGTLIGAGLGSAIGGGGGKVAENALEGNKLSRGVAGEAALSGVLGAGPLRLGKAAIDTVKGVRAGTGIAEALAQGGKAGTEMSLTKSVGDRLSKSGQGLIAKEFRLSPTQQSNFSKLHGEEATSVLKRYGVKAPEDVQTKIQPLQDAFDNAVTSIPAVGKAELDSGLKKIYEPLLKSPALFEQGLGSQVKQQADELLKLTKKGSLPADKVNELRKTFDSAVKYTQKGAPEYNVIKKTADALRGTLQGAADKAGVKTAEGMSFKDVGKELRKLYGIDEIVGKQSYLGSGNLPVSLPNLLGGAAGGAAGGLPGAALGTAGTLLTNSAMGRRAITNTALKAGEKLSERGANNAANAYSLGGVAKRVAPAGIAGALGDQSLGQMTQPMTDTSMITNTTNIPTSYQESPQMSTPDNNPFDVANVAASVQKLAQGGASNKDIQEYLSIASAMQSLQSNATKSSGGLNSTAAGVVADTKSGLRSLDNLSGAITDSSANNPLIGGLRALNPFDTNAQNLQAQVATAKQIVGKALEGGVLRKEDEAKYAKLLPTMRDSDSVAQFKIQQLQGLISSRLNDYLSGINGGTGGADQQTLSAALGM